MNEHEIFDSLVAENSVLVWDLLKKYDVIYLDDIRSNIFEAYKLYGNAFALELIEIFKNNPSKWSNIGFFEGELEAANGTSNKSNKGEEIDKPLNFWDKFDKITSSVFGVLNGISSIFGKKDDKEEEARLAADLKRRQQQQTTIIIISVVVLIILVIIFLILKKKK